MGITMLQSYLNDFWQKVIIVLTRARTETGVNTCADAKRALNQRYEASKKAVLSQLSTQFPGCQAHQGKVMVCLLDSNILRGGSLEPQSAAAALYQFSREQM